MNEADAERAGRARRRSVRVVSRRGSVVAPAKVGDVVPAGVVFVPFHYGELGEEHAANNLMPQTWDPVSKQPVQKVRRRAHRADRNDHGSDVVAGGGNAMTRHGIESTR